MDEENVRYQVSREAENWEELNLWPIINSAVDNGRITEEEAAWAYNHLGILIVIAGELT